jgi:Sulfotransferase domain
MKVIGAGLPRTGTLSQKLALEMLGLGPCHHMVDVLKDLDQVPRWSAAVDGQADWEATFAGYQSAVDWPAGFFYKELIDVYPEAKVILSVRDDDTWERSVRATVWAVRNGRTLVTHLSEARARIDPQWQSYLALIDRLLWTDTGTFAGDHASPAGLRTAFEAHNREVQRTVPSERLLVWRVSEGWDPLCRFLGVEAPEAEFPRANDSQMFTQMLISSSLARLQSWWSEQSGPPPTNGHAGTAVPGR